MIAPLWVRGNTESQLWTSLNLVDSATTGDRWADSWEVFCSGGIDRIQFYLIPPSSEVRALSDPCRLAGVTRVGDSIGTTQAHTLSGSVGRVSAICADSDTSNSR